MHNFNLNAMGFKEMNSKEIKQTDGGSFLLIGAVVLTCLALASCNNNTINVQIGGGQKNEQKQAPDSTNCN